MNKKVVLSVLATAVVASMAASAFAAPKTGLYIGGNVKKFYSNDTLINMTKDARATYKNELKTIGFKNLVYVNFKGQGATIQEMIDLGVKVAMADPLKQSDFLESYGVVQKDGTINGTEVPKVDPVPTGDLKVDSVSAIDSTSFKVTFNKEVQAVLPANFLVADKESGVRNYAQSAILSADKKSATVTVYDAFTSGKTYKVEASDIKDADGKVIAAGSKEFTYTTPVPATIGFKSTKLPVGNAVNLNDYIVVKDAEGNELKSGYVVSYTANVPVVGGVVNTTGVSSLIVNATITKEDNTTITTGNVVLSVEAATVSSIDTFGLVDSVDGGTKAITTFFLNGSGIFADGTATTGTVSLGATFKDQFGNAIGSAATVYESLTPTVLAVSSSGTLIPIQPGKALVRVTNGTLTKTIEIEVKANPVATTLEAPATLAVVGSATAPTGTFKLTVKDQYGNKVAGNTAVAITNSDSTVATVAAPANAVNGELTVTVQGQKAGTTKLTLTAGTLTKEVIVNASAAGTVSGYKVEASDDSIDLNAAANDADATVKVYEVDANGNKIKDLTANAASITAADLHFELPATGSLLKPKTGGTANQFEAVAGATTGSTIVTIKAGTLTIGTATVNVVNTTDAVASRELVSPLVKVNTAPGTFTIDDVAKNIKMVTKSGKELNNTTDLATKVAAISKVVTSNSNAITVANDVTVTAANVVGAKQTATLTVIFADSKLSPVAFNVEVSDVTPPAAAATTPIVFTDVNDNGTIDAGDKITIKFSEPVDSSKITLDNILVSNDHVLGTVAAPATITTTDKQTYVITLGATTVQSDDTLTIGKANVVDVAGNAATDNVVFVVPTV